MTPLLDLIVCGFSCLGRKFPFTSMRKLHKNLSLPSKMIGPQLVWIRVSPDRETKKVEWSVLDRRQVLDFWSEEMCPYLIRENLRLRPSPHTYGVRKAVSWPSQSRLSTCDFHEWDAVQWDCLFQTMELI